MGLNSTELPVCAGCGAPAVQGQDMAVCRVCSGQYHLKCAKLKKSGKNFGCAKCFVDPGNTARIPIQEGASGVDQAKDTDDETVVDLADDKSTPRLPAKGMRPAKPPSVSSVGTKSSKDEIIRSLMKQNAALIDVISKSVHGSACSGSSRGTNHRVAKWLETHNGRSAGERVDIPSNPARDQSFNPAVASDVRARCQEERHPRQDSTNLDLTLEATRAGTSSDFLNCLATTKAHALNQGSHRYTRTPPDLLPFNGDVREWPRFIGNYIESTLEFRVSDLSNIARLEKALGPLPLEVLRTTMVLPSSLPDALDQIRVRFYNPSRLIELLEQDVTNAKPVGDKGENLHELSSLTSGLTNTLKACGLQEQLAGASLVTKLQRKLSCHFGMRWSDYRKDRVGDLELFTEFLKAQVMAAIDVGQMQIVPSSRTAKPVMTMAAVNKPAVQRITTPARVTTTSTTTTSPAVACPLCDRAHALVDCPEFQQKNSGERLQVTTDKRLCWSCLMPRNRHNCRRLPCNVPDCRYRHHPLLHEALTLKFANVSATTRWPSFALCKILPVRLRNGDKELEVFAFIDEGSTVTMVETAVADELGLTGPINPLTVRWTDDSIRHDPNSRETTLQITGALGDSFLMREVRTMDVLKLPDQSLPESLITEFFPDGDGPAPFTDAYPKIVIGLLHAHLSVPLEVKEHEVTHCIAARTRLGWMVYGGTGPSRVMGLNLRVCHHREVFLKPFPEDPVTPDEDPDEALSKLVKCFFDTESFGVRAAPRRLGATEERALEILQNTVRHTGDRYEAGLLWNSSQVSLPPSRNMCLRRATSLAKRLEANPALAKRVQDILNEYLELGYIRNVTDQPPKEPLWFLPIFPVSNPNKPDKTRIVYDAAARVSDGRSLNSFLLSGPDLLVALPEVLMRFRERRVAVTADVKAMFHQVQIREEDKDAQRFLWIPPGTTQVIEYRLEVMTFGAACSPTTAQYVQRKNADLFKSQFPDAVNEIHRSFYVDDELSSFDDEDTARRVMQEVTSIQRHAGMEMCKMRSNVPAVLPPSQEVGDAKLVLPSECDRVLGMIWDSEADTLQFATKNILRIRDVEPLTRRRILSGTMSLFDPLGLGSIVVVKGKMINRSCLDLTWDERVSGEVKRRWMEWCDMLQSLDGVAIPRFHGIAPNTEWEMHTFVDASEAAFIAAAYFRGTAPNGTIVCSLVMAKSRAAPRKTLTIPRMELQAAVMGSRLAGCVQAAATVQIVRRYWWTDSRDVKCWVCSSHRRYNQWVASRINEILNETEEKEWRWVPTKDNVADDATRLSSPVDSARWLRGPEFLYEDPSKWPQEQPRQQEPLELLQPVMTVAAVNMGLIPDIGRFSMWYKLVRTTAYALRFFLNWKLMEDLKKNQLSASELERAEDELFRAAQLELYADVVTQLRKNSEYTLPKKHVLHKLCPVLDSKGILRVDGRLPPALFGIEVRQPIILPAKSRITYLMVQTMHRRYMHCQFETVINEIRRNFHIYGLRRLLRSVCRACQRCQILRPKARPPQMGPLPAARVAIGWRCFTYCGLDYAGPYEVVVGRRREKRWLALFTCLTTRAIHVEVVHSLSTSSCIMAVRKMCARRDVQPLEMWSDNATCFKGADNELKRLLEEFPLMKWMFNPPAAPHMGGAWERMIGLLKRCLDAIISDRALTDEILSCASVEVEWVVNSHPLTEVVMGADAEEALTPLDFLHGASRRRSHDGIGGFCEPIQLTRKCWRLAQQIASHFWARFSREVIPQLNLRTKWYERMEPMSVGDVVMVPDEGRRGYWKKGRVVELIQGRRGDQVRQLRINLGGTTVTRPTAKVARLDNVVV